MGVLLLGVSVPPVKARQKLCLPEAKDGSAEDCGKTGGASCGCPLDYMPKNDYLRNDSVHGGLHMSRLLLTSFLLFVLTLPALSESQPAEIERLIKQLGSDSFAEREAASKVLKDIGEPALEALNKVASHSHDAEVRRRAKDLTRSIEGRLYTEL